MSGRVVEGDRLWLLFLQAEGGIRIFLGSRRLGDMNKRKIL